MSEVKKEEKVNRDKYIYPVSQVGSGIMQSFFSTYLSSLLTMIYVFPIAIAGTLETLSQISAFIAGPITGSMMDRLSFNKKAKYWPWFLTALIGIICWVLIYVMPVLSNNPSKLVFVALVVVLVQRFVEGARDMIHNLIYTLIAKDGKARSFMSMAGKVGRDSMKVIIGFLFPLMLAGFLGMGMDEVKSWALIAVILASCSFIIQIVALLLQKNSNIEKEAIAELQAGMKTAKQQPRPLSKTIATIFTNRNLLSVFIAHTMTRMYFFYHVMGGMFLWRYYMQNMGMLAVFMSLYSLSAVIGAMVSVPIGLRTLKDTRRCAVAAYICQAIFYGIAYFVISPANPWGTILIICAASFFNGASDSFIMPLFAHGADYSAWKSGNKDYGLNMAVFGISVTLGILFTAITRTAILAAGGFVSAELTPAAMAAGAVVPEGVKQALHNLNSLYPFLYCIVIIILLVFVYNLNDKKVAEIQKKIAERDAAAGA